MTRKGGGGEKPEGGTPRGENKQHHTKWEGRQSKPRGGEAMPNVILAVTGPKVAVNRESREKVRVRIFFVLKHVKTLIRIFDFVIC